MMTMMTLAPYIVLGLTIIASVGVTAGLIRRWLPLVVYILAAGLVLQTTLLGTHIVGVDIHTEYSVVQVTLARGWDPGWSNLCNTSPVIVGIAPALSRLGVPVIFQFRVVYPLISALAPVILFLAYRKVFGEKTAFLGAVFFATMPMFTMEMTSMVKSEIAYVFGALSVLGVCSAEWKAWKRWTVVAVGAVGALLCHYSVGNMVMAYALVIPVLAVAVLWVRRPSGLRISRRAVWSTVCVVAAVAVAYFGWYSWTAQGSLIKTTAAMLRNITAVTRTVISTSDGVSDNTGILREYTRFVDPTGQMGEPSTYLQRQPAVVQTALGLDFMQSSTLGKIFRILQYITQASMILGLALLWKRRREIPVAYTAGVLASFGILTLCIFVPFLSTTMSPTRFYALALFWISPLFIASLKWLSGSHWVPLVILIAYMLFSSGFVFEATGSETTDRLDIPFSYAFSANRLGLIGLYTSNDLAAIRWLDSSTDLTKPVFTSYLGTSLMLELPELDGLYRHTETRPGGAHYRLVTEWEMRHGVEVTGWTGGLRKRLPLNLDGYTEIARFGDAAVYRSYGSS